jgi:thiol:disulfide interchange protein
LIRIYFILILLALAFFAVRRFINTPASTLSRPIRHLALLLAALPLLYLGLTGRLAWLLALAGLIFAALARWTPVILRYAPQLQRLWVLLRSGKQQQSTQSKTHTQSKDAMSLDEAYAVLGLKKNASPQEIVDAHRKLMQKLHPDRGGSDYFAAKINLAKAILLKNK